jgi:hypothetical protein
MNHNELLTKIVYKDVWDDELTKFQLRNALCAVVKLHKPIIEEGGRWCDYCKVKLYPCPIIEAIEKELS